MVNLSVNINKIATLRNARGGNMPCVLQVALDIEKFGADGITVHPRPDERHIRRSDVYELKPALHTEFNIEGFPDKRFMDMVLEVKPHQATLVPDAPSVLTSSQGWPVAENREFLTTIVARLKEAGIRVSIFVDATEERVRQAAEVGADRVELYTGPFAQMFSTSPEKAVEPYTKAAQVAHEVGLGLNAGHDLNLLNLKFFKDNVPYLDEVSIGHALISDALYLGLERTIDAYRKCLL
ncbi:MAG: pyridoxine 5'-phosphate synthase [Muribaculaceae bacterium]|nr:pyridoxine 5'-phosphate synthase [Muribaculaceae bacterium]MBQ6279439.1 pyridoxine 5'-phosphate synthase [Muribaculaceae bacterium]MBR0023971.1 pyridoxine 5'-phosphate synthase [Muribaculaceae bacterium]